MPPTFPYVLGVKVSVHEQGTLINIDTDGINIQPGIKAEVNVRPTRTRRLSAPYSDCDTQVCRLISHILYTVADPGFPIGGAPTCWGAPTSDAYTFQQKCMRKQKKLILLGGGGGTHWRHPPGSVNDIHVLESTRLQSKLILLSLG